MVRADREVGTGAVDRGRAAVEAGPGGDLAEDEALGRGAGSTAELRAGERDVRRRLVDEVRELVEPAARPAGDDPEGEEVVPSGVVLGGRDPKLLADLGGGGPLGVGPDHVVDPDRQVIDVGDDGG